MKSVPLTAHARTVGGRNAVKQLRESGRVPTVMYGRKQASRSLEVATRDLDLVIGHSASENILVDLEITGESLRRLALVQEVQHDPLSGAILHVDFHEVAADEKVTLQIPLESVGVPAGVKEGGVLEHVLFKVKVRALPEHLPAVLEVDVSQLGLGSVLHLGEIPAPEGVEILGDKKVPVLAVAAPRTEVEETPAGTEGAPKAEVEMIKEKKDDTAGGDKKAGAEKK